MTNTPRPVKGFSLVEVLIALFILAVGILGIIGLQLYAKQSNSDAIQRTTASSLAADIIERMRMNKSSLASYISSAVPIPPSAAMPTTCGSATAPCDPAAVATRDLAIWHALISGAAAESVGGKNIGGLITPSACIIQNPDGKPLTEGEKEYRIVIAWRGPTALTNPSGDPCGEDVSGVRYGPNNVYRRIFILNAKIE